jgi:methylmalonyl-CoA/ethylmalonyl-CoA epimerase
MNDNDVTRLDAAVGALDHVAMIVDDLDMEAARYRDVFSAEVSPTEVHAQYGCSSAFVDLGYSRLRLFQAHDATSPITTFFGPHSLAGIHHVCYRVEEIEAASIALKMKGYRPLGTGDYKRSNHGKRMLFLRPPDLPGPLVKLEEP